MFIRFRCVLLLVCLSQVPALYADEKLLLDLMSKDARTRKEASQKVVESRNLSLVPSLVDAIFYTPKNARTELIATLEKLTGEKPGKGYYEWVELIGRRKDIKPAPDYLQWKVSLLSRIDPAYRKILYPEIPSRIRVEEIVWGGVKLDGIPSLEKPQRVAAADADFMQDDEKVFGIIAGGKAQALPHRVVSWHEMVNDEIGGEPVTFSF